MKFQPGPLSLSPRPRFRFVGYSYSYEMQVRLQRAVRRQMSHGNRVLSVRWTKTHRKKLIDRIEPSGVTIYRETIRRLTIVSLGESPLRIRSEQRPQNPRNPRSPIANLVRLFETRLVSICLAINAKRRISAKPGEKKERERGDE